MRSRIAVLALLLLVVPASCGGTSGDAPGDGGDGGVQQAAGPDARRSAAPVAGSAYGGDPYWPLDGNGSIDVRHYTIRVAYDFAERRVRGTTVLSVRALEELSSFSLDILLPVGAVTVDGRPATFSKPHRHELRVRPGRTVPKGDVVTVAVRYRGLPSTISYAGGRSWLANGSEVVTMNEPHMAPWWYPANDHPRDKATFDIYVDVPRSKEVVSNGVRVGRVVRGTRAVTHWRMSDPMTTYLAFFAAGDFVVETGRTASGIPFYNAVSARLPATERGLAQRTLRRTASITDWLQSRLGRYPFRTTGGVVTSLPVGFALENQSRPTYGSWIYPSVIVHELAHQWFGDSVSVRRWRDIWINEGFATFAEVWYAAEHGGRSISAWLDRTYDAACSEADSPFWQLQLDDPGADNVFDQAVYDRGAMVLAALRNRVGVTDFNALLRRWVAAHHDGNATVAQFEELAETVDGSDLDGFFDAWLRGDGPPDATADNGLRRAC